MIETEMRRANILSPKKHEFRINKVLSINKNEGSTCKRGDLANGIPEKSPPAGLQELVPVSDEFPYGHMVPRPNGRGNTLSSFSVE